jgi:sugar phosphate permease
MKSATAAAYQAADPSRRSEGTTTVTLAVLCQVFHGLTFSGLAVFLPLVRDDLGLSFAEGGLLAAAMTVSYGLGQIPAGYLSDRFGPKRLVFIGFLVWSALSLTLGLIHSFWLAVLNQLVAGAFRALMFAPGLSLLASWFPPERRATAMSLYMVGGFSGTILVSLGGPLLAMQLGWRYAFILLAALGIAVAFVFHVYGREKPRKPDGTAVSITEALRLFRHRILWVCSGIQFVRFSIVTAFNFWLPSVLVADRGFSLEAAGLVAAMSAALTAPSNALGGYVSDRLKNPPLVIGGSLAILAAVSVLIVVVDSTALLLLVIAIGSIFLQFYFGPLFFVPMEVLGQRTAGTAIGFNNLFANIGGALSAYALGMARDAAGSFVWGFFGIGALCLTGAGLSVVLARMRTRALAAQKRAATP